MRAASRIWGGARAQTPWAQRIHCRLGLQSVCGRRGWSESRSAGIFGTIMAYSDDSYARAAAWRAAWMGRRDLR